MRKFIVGLYLCCVFLSSLHAQDTKNQLDTYLRNFQYQKALEYIDTQEPSKELLMQKAFCYKALGNYQKTIEILQPLSQEYDDDIQIKAELALNYHMMSQLELSADVYNDLITTDSTNIYFKIQKADILYQQGKYSEALVLYQNLLEESRLTNMLKRSAQCFEKMNMSDSAMLYYKQAWDANVKDAFSAASLINLCIKNKRTMEAQVYSDAYIATDSTDKQINLLNALSYYSLDLYEEAVARFEKCYQKGDSSLIVNRSLGIAYYSLGESEPALKYLDKAYAQDSTNTNVLYCLAVTCRDMSEYDRAVHYFKVLLDRTIPPDMTLYLYYKGLAIAYEKNQQNQEAVDAYILSLGYATENQKMFLYYTIAQLYELFLTNDAEAYIYYQLYRKSLNDYLNVLKSKEEQDPIEIKDGEIKIKALDEYIERLKARLGKSS